MRAQVKFEILESADLLAHFEDPPTQKAESGSDLTIEAADPQSSGILQLFSIAAMSVGFVGLPRENGNLNYENKEGESHAIARLEHQTLGNPIPSRGNSTPNRSGITPCPTRAVAKGIHRIHGSDRRGGRRRPLLAHRTGRKTIQRSV